jgi:hypothetical protein
MKKTILLAALALIKAVKPFKAWATPISRSQDMSFLAVTRTTISKPGSQLRAWTANRCRSGLFKGATVRLN